MRATILLLLLLVPGACSHSSVATDWIVGPGTATELQITGGTFTLRNLGPAAVTLWPDQGAERLLPAGRALSGDVAPWARMHLRNDATVPASLALRLRGNPGASVVIVRPTGGQSRVSSGSRR